MPKLRTNKALADRIKVTKTGKLMHQKAGRSHLLNNKGKSHKQHQGGKELFHQQKRIRTLIPHML